MHLFGIAGVLLEIHSIQAFPDLSQIVLHFRSQIILFWNASVLTSLSCIILIWNATLFASLSFILFSNAPLLVSSSCIFLIWNATLLPSLIHYLYLKCLSVGILHPVLKCPSFGIIILHYLNLKCHSVAIINSLSLSEMPLCWHHYLALSQPRSNFAPRGRITPMGGPPYKASILNHN